jgi:putative addiction module component (TIGR02574 family)
MTLAQIQEMALALPVADRLQLETIWDSINDGAQTLPLSGEQRALLDRRLADNAAHPEKALTWEQVRAQLDELL